MEQLIKEALIGDIEAFEQLINKEKPRLLSKALSYTGNQEDAKDIVQETIIKAFNSLHQLKQPTFFSTWLFKILIHESYALLNKRKRTLAIDVQLVEQAKVDAHSEPSSFDALYEALASLKEEYRTAIVLHYFYDFSLAELAFMLDKPLNTIKTYLFRGRRTLKQQLQHALNIPISKMVMTTMLKEELAKLAISFVHIPQHFELMIEDYQHDRAAYVWADNFYDDGVAVTLDSQGKLLVLTTNPTKQLAKRISLQQQQRIAEQFLTAQYSEALRYLTLTSTVEKQDLTQFIYAQHVYGLPLQKHQTFIEVSHSGEVLTFYYKGYTSTPPSLPKTIIEKETITEQFVKQGNWQLTLCYLSKNIYDVEQSGLYKIYQNRALSQLFDASTGETNTPEENHYESDITAPFPNVQPTEKETSIEQIVGISETMIILRKQETDNNIWIVWGDNEENTFQDRTFVGFLREQTEKTVKVKLDKTTKELKEFVWFKERVGNLQLSFEQCKQIACTFMATYFEQFVPYLSLKIEAPNFNEANRAFFSFPLHDGNKFPIEGEQFNLSVNRTTGLIDMCTAPQITLEDLEAYIDQPVLAMEHFQNSFDQIDTCLTWSVEYEESKSYEKLNYMLCHTETRQKIIGIHAITGELISYKL